jgi:hypothetical protein
VCRHFAVFNTLRSVCHKILYSVRISRPREHEGGCLLICCAVYKFTDVSEVHAAYIVRAIAHSAGCNNPEDSHLHLQACVLQRFATVWCSGPWIVPMTATMRGCEGGVGGIGHVLL